jgi:RNA polymerase sigma factor for flagellar operon FliA
MSSTSPFPTPVCARSALLKQHRPLVQRIARRLKASVPANVDIDDLIQVGMLGLDQALNGYEQGHGTAFDTYAARRIHGAMLDELRQQDHLSRLTRSRLRQIRTAVHKLEHELGRPPRALEISRNLGWTLKEFHDAMVAGGAASLRLGDGDLDIAENEASLAEFDDADVHSSAEHADPATALEQRQQMVAVNKAFADLSDQERTVLSLLYVDEMTATAVAEQLGASASRISQIHASAVAKLRVGVKKQELPAARKTAMSDTSGSVQIKCRVQPAPAPDWLDKAAAQFLRPEETEVHA